MSSINERFKEVRKSIGMSQKSLGEVLGISHSHISGIENGKDMPSTTLIKFLCFRFNISEKWMLTGKGSMEPLCSNDSDASMVARYNSIRVHLDRLIAESQGTDLISIVNALAYLDILVSAAKLVDHDKTAYLTAICATIDEFEKMIFHVSSSLYPGKNEVDDWLSYMDRCNQLLKKCTDNMKTAANVYLARHNKKLSL